MLLDSQIVNFQAHREDPSTASLHRVGTLAHRGPRPRALPACRVCRARAAAGASPTPGGPSTPSPKGSPPGLPGISLLSQEAEETPEAEAQDPQESSTGSQQPWSGCCPPAVAPSRSWRSAWQRAALGSTSRAGLVGRGSGLRVPGPGCHRPLCCGEGLLPGVDEAAQGLVGMRGKHSSPSPMPTTDARLQSSREHRGLDGGLASSSPGENLGSLALPPEVPSSFHFPVPASRGRPAWGESGGCGGDGHPCIWGEPGPSGSTAWALPEAPPASILAASTSYPALNQADRRAGAPQADVW